MSNAYPPWLRLFGPLPRESAPRSSSVGGVEVDADPSNPIRGWKGLTVEIGFQGVLHRIVHVVVDANGKLISGSDHVIYRESRGGSSVEMEQNSIGGRFETDGSFRGTCWQVVGPEPAEGEEPNWVYTPRQPTREEVAGLRVVVAEVLRRGGIG